MADFGKLNFSVSFNPTSAFPIDARTVFTSYAAAVAAAATAEEVGSSTTVYYIGQNLTVVEGMTAIIYTIQPDKSLKAAGEQGTVTVNGDKKSIDVTGDTISVHGYGVAYDKYVRGYLESKRYTNLSNVYAVTVDMDAANYQVILDDTTGVFGADFSGLQSVLYPNASNNQVAAILGRVITAVGDSATPDAVEYVLVRYANSNAGFFLLAKNGSVYTIKALTVTNSEGTTAVVTETSTGAGISAIDYTDPVAAKTAGAVITYTTAGDPNGYTKIMDLPATSSTENIFTSVSFSDAGYFTTISGWSMGLIPYVGYSTDGITGAITTSSVELRWRTQNLEEANTTAGVTLYGSIMEAIATAASSAGTLEPQVTENTEAISTLTADGGTPGSVQNTVNTSIETALTWKTSM